jgi:SNF2 family DNA or RNA helicase
MHLKQGDKMNQTLDFQNQAIEFLKTKQFGACFLPMGTGKTLIAIRIMESVKDRFLYVTKKTIIGSVVSEIKKWSNLPYHVYTSANSKKGIPDTTVLITNYELLHNHFEIFKGWMELPNSLPVSIILDESNSIKTYSAQCTRAALELSKYAQNKYIFSGTSITRGFEDWFSQFKFLSPDVMPGYITAFRQMYCDMERKSFNGKCFQVITGYRNITNSLSKSIVPLMDRIKPYTFFKKKEDCISLPEKTYTVEKFKMNDQHRAVYNKMKKWFVTDLKDHTLAAPVLITRIMKLMQIANGFIIDEVQNTHKLIGDNMKIQWLRDFMETILPDFKMVIFTRFIESFNQVHEFLQGSKYLRDNNWFFAFLESNMNSDIRQSMIDKFQTDPRCKIFLSPLKIGSYGVTLTAASYCVFYNNDYNYGDRMQAEDRIHRIGQTKNCHYIDLVMEGTVEEGVIENHKGKKGLISISEEGLTVESPIDDLKQILSYGEGGEKE